jgi:hypothetical protein
MTRPPGNHGGQTLCEAAVPFYCVGIFWCEAIKPRAPQADGS